MSFSIQGHGGRNRAAILAALIVSVWTPATHPAHAVEAGGSVRLFAGSTNVDGLDTDVGEQRYLVNLSQRFGPWMGMALLYRGSRDTTSTDTFEFERRSSAPQVVLTYDRPVFSARLDYTRRENRGSTPSANLDVESAIAQFELRPPEGPRYLLNFRDDSNVADQQVFGTDTGSRQGSFEVVYDRGRFNGSGLYSVSELDNKRTGLSIDQRRLLLRAAYANQYIDDRLSFSGDVWFSEVDQTESIPTGTLLAQPVSSARGLAAIDTTPMLGPLDGSVQLNDGDVTTPVSPPIEIGGANTFRNIGLDLGVSKRVTRLELTVDGVSGPALLWEVYRSPDNDNWNLVPQVATEWDPVNLRYTVFIPETTDRHFKLVNLSPNPVANVRVTELRALLDIETIGRQESDTAFYRLGANVGFDATSRLRLDLALAASNEQDLFAGQVSQEARNASLNTGLQYDLGRSLRLDLSYFASRFEQDLAPVLSRTEVRSSAGLDWSPRPELRGSVDFLRREESDRGDPIRTTQSVRGRLHTRFFRELALRSELKFSDVEDRGAGFSQQNVRWAETLESRPTANLSMDGGFVVTWFDTDGLSTVSRRVDFNLMMNWQLVRFLTLIGTFGARIDDETDNINQRYALAWSPGRRFNASLYYQDAEAENRRVTSYGGGTSYRLNRWFRFLLSMNNSRSEQPLGTATNRSGRIGLLANF